ncbi:MAG TPA: ABC transporter permease subunit [Actinoplanes sp.]|nr:ABC transporter permease subunit [Actinoplanes sp.]
MTVDPLRAGIRWLAEPVHWNGPAGLLDRLQEHLVITGLAVLLAVGIGWPAGVLLGHRGRGGQAVRVGSTLAAAVPVLGLLTVLPLTPLGFGRPAIVVALGVLAVPPLLSGAYIGVRQIEPATRDAAHGCGLTGGQLLLRVELPLAVPYLLAGLRVAVAQVVASAALVALVDGGGLGQVITAGIGMGLDAGGAGQVVAGALVLAGLALLLTAGVAALQRVPGLVVRVSLLFARQPSAATGRSR